MRIGIDIDGVITDIERFIADYGTKYCIENNMNIQNIIKFVRKEIDEFAGNAERADDITMLAFKDFTISPN